jgi:hypothetical protein
LAVPASQGSKEGVQPADYQDVVTGASSEIAFVHSETGEFQEQELPHREEAEKFYRDPAGQGMKSRVGMEARGHARWFERLWAELNLD